MGTFPTKNANQSLADLAQSGADAGSLKPGPGNYCPQCGVPKDRCGGHYAEKINPATPQNDAPAPSPFNIGPLGK